jgi:hypothetical protein
VAKRKKKTAPKPATESFEETVNRLRAAVEASQTWDEFEEARSVIRHTLSYPVIVNSTDLWGVCERKRLTFDVQLSLESPPTEDRP